MLLNVAFPAPQKASTMGVGVFVFPESRDVKQPPPRPATPGVSVGVRLGEGVATGEEDRDEPVDGVGLGVGVGLTGVHAIMRTVWVVESAR